MAQHEQMSEKQVALIWRGSKLTVQTLARMMKKFLDDLQKQKTLKKAPKTYQGKQTIKQLVGQGQGVSNIDGCGRNKILRLLLKISSK